jgi:hypothetical protein
MKIQERTNYRILISILIVSVTVLLIDIHYESEKCAELVDQYFDLQSEYQRVFDETIRLEEENQILGSMVGQLEAESEYLTDYIVNEELKSAQ